MSGVSSTAQDTSAPTGAAVAAGAHADAKPPLPLSAVVITRNEADRLPRLLHSLQGVVTETVVVDSGSTDATVDVARAAGARVVHQDWLGFGAQKNAAMALAAQPWLLLMDADEWLAPGADATLRALFASGEVEQADVWRLQRHNHFLGGRLRRPESMPRLVRPGVRFLPMLVHERMDVAGRRVRVSTVAIEHDTARTWDDHLRKQDRYADLWARQRHAEGRRCGPAAAWTHVVAYWLKSYVARAGFLDGRAGWLFHRAHARAVLRKYRGLHALSRGARPAAPAE